MNGNTKILSSIITFSFVILFTQNSLSQANQKHLNQDEIEQKRKAELEEKEVDLKADIATIKEKDVLEEKVKELRKVMAEQKSNSGYFRKESKSDENTYTGNTPVNGQNEKYISPEEKASLERNKKTNKNLDLIRETTNARKKALVYTSTNADSEIEKAKQKLEKLTAKIESDFQSKSINEASYKKKQALIKRIEDNIDLLVAKNEEAKKLLEN